MNPDFNLGKLIRSVVLLFVVLTLMVSCAGKSDTSELTSNNLIGDELVKAPAFKLVSTAGDTISLQDYKGKTLVLHIATTWCPYCNAEAPYLEDLYKTYRTKDVEVLIIDVKEDKQLVVDKLVNRFQLSFPVLLDTDGTAAARFAPEDVLPELARDEIMLASNIIIDKEGNILFMSLLDTKNFDTKLIHLKKKLDEIL